MTLASLCVLFNEMSPRPKTPCYFIGDHSLDQPSSTLWIGIIFTVFHAFQRHHSHSSKIQQPSASFIDLIHSRNFTKCVQFRQLPSVPPCHACRRSHQCSPIPASVTNLHQLSPNVNFINQVHAGTLSDSWHSMTSVIFGNSMNRDEV